MKVSEMMEEKEHPKASEASGAASARYRDYVIEKNSNGDEALPFKEWYELHQQGKL